MSLYDSRIHMRFVFVRISVYVYWIKMTHIVDIIEITNTTHKIHHLSLSNVYLCFLPYPSTEDAVHIPFIERAEFFSFALSQQIKKFVRFFGNVAEQRMEILFSFNFWITIIIVLILTSTNIHQPTTHPPIYPLLFITNINNNNNRSFTVLVVFFLFYFIFCLFLFVFFFCFVIVLLCKHKVRWIFHERTIDGS